MNFVNLKLREINLKRRRKSYSSSAWKEFPRQKSISFSQRRYEAFQSLSHVKLTCPEPLQKLLPPKMGTAEFPDLGKHCSVEECKLIDFLPFTCDRCKKVFCLQHRSYATHSCPNANQQDVTVLVCPLCAKAVRLIPNQDPNITWDIHVNTDCDPSNYQKATKKKRCPVPGCRELLTFSNTIRCRDCTQEHCLKHRFGPDHKCPGPKKPHSGFPFTGLLKRSQTVQSTPSSSGGGSSWWSSGLRGGMQKLSSATNEVLHKAKDGMAMEQCPRCSARFASVGYLIEHVEKSHGKGVKQ